MADEPILAGGQADPLAELLRAAEAGDPACLPWLREALDRPEVTDLIGNLARQVEDRVIEGLTGPNLAYREGIARHLAQMRQDLAGPDPTPVERHLAERIAVCWLVLHDAELRRAAVDPSQRKLAAFWEGRVDAAHRRYLSAVKALATVRKLAVPVLIGQVNIAHKQVNKATASPTPVQGTVTSLPGAAQTPDCPT